MRLGKSLINKNQIHYNKFWDKIVNSRHKTIRDTGRYKKKLEEHMEEISDV